MINTTNTDICEAAVNYKKAYLDHIYAKKNGGIDKLREILFNLIDKQINQANSKNNVDIAQIVENTIGKKYVSIIANGIVRLENILHHNENGFCERQIVNFSEMGKNFYIVNKSYFECHEETTPIGDRRETMCKYLQGSNIDIPNIKYL
ncbi:MAG: hypothetical protein QM500_03575 [Methylococcales bacterium]